MTPTKDSRKGSRLYNNKISDPQIYSTVEVGDDDVDSNGDGGDYYCDDASVMNRY